MLLPIGSILFFTSVETLIRNNQTSWKLVFDKKICYFIVYNMAGRW